MKLVTKLLLVAIMMISLNLSLVGKQDDVTPPVITCPDCLTIEEVNAMTQEEIREYINSRDNQ